MHFCEKNYEIMLHYEYHEIKAFLESSELHKLDSNIVSLQCIPASADRVGFKLVWNVHV